MAFLNSQPASLAVRDDRKRSLPINDDVESMDDVTQTGCLGVVVIASSSNVTTFIVNPLYCTSGYKHKLM